jgi:hypothetical protein
VQDVRWNGSDTDPAGEYTFFYGKWYENHTFGTVSLHKRITSAVKRVEFVRDRLSHIVLRGRRFHITLVSFYARTEDKMYDMKNSFK